MQSADIVILVVLAIPAIVGVIYGFLNIVFSLLAWVLASGIAVKGAPLIAPMLEAYIETPLIRSVVAFAGVFIISLMIFSLLGYFVVKLLGRTGLTAADRILGLVLGFGLGTGIVWAVVFLSGFTAFPKEDWWQSSKVIRPFQHMSVWAHQFLPENMAKHHGYELEENEPDAVAKAPVEDKT